MSYNPLKRKPQAPKEQEQKIQTVDLRTGDVIDVSMYDLHQYFEGSIIRGKLRPIVGNHAVRLTGTLLWVLSHLSVLFRGESGSAKSETMKAIVALMWGEDGLDGIDPDLYMIDKTSEKGTLNQPEVDRITGSRYCYIPELQNAKSQEWILKKWAEGEPARYTRSTQGGQDNEELLLKPLPTISNLADFNEELRDLTNEWKRRLISLYMLSSESINKEVHKNKGKTRMYRMSSLVKTGDAKLEALRQRMFEASRIDDRVINPYALVMQEIIPKKYTDSNTFIDYWYDFIEAVCKFHYPERLRKADEVDQDDKMFCTFADNKMAVDIAGTLFVHLCLGIPELGTEILDMFPKLQYEEVPDLGSLNSFDDNLGKTKVRKTKNPHFKSAEEVQDLLDKAGYPRKLEWVIDTLDRLVMGGALRRTKGGKGDSYFRTRDVHVGKMFDASDWDKIRTAGREFMKQEYPEYYDEWLKTEKDTYIHPFSGFSVGVVDIGTETMEEFPLSEHLGAREDEEV